MLGTEGAARWRPLLEWPESLALIRAEVRILGDGGVRPAELCEVLLGHAPPRGTRYARIGLRGPGGMDLCSAPAFVQKGPRPREATETLVRPEALVR